MSDTRVSKKEWNAIAYALGAVLAGELDGYDRDEPEYDEMVDALQSAQKKVWERLGPLTDEAPDG